MKTGDLVTLKEWCKNSGRIAIISETASDLSCVKITFLDTFCVAVALKTNLILLEAK